MEPSSLSRPFSIDEVDRVVATCNASKSPGPDGFNFDFIKSFRDLLHSDVNTLFEKFYSNAKLPKYFLHTLWLLSQKFSVLFPWVIIVRFLY